MKDLKDYLLAVCGDKDAKKKLKSLLEEKASTAGLLVCRRFVNFPYEMVPKMYDSLFDEVSWATEDEVGFQLPLVKNIPFCWFYAYNDFFTVPACLKPTQELQDSFRFKQYLLLVRIFEVSYTLCFLFL